MAATAGFTTSRTQKPRPIQKAPKVPKPVAPTTFLLRNSHMAAHSWANPPYAKAKPSQALPVAWVIHPAFLADSRNVVRAKAASPSGPGSAIAETGIAGVGAGWTVRSSLTLKRIPPK